MSALRSSIIELVMLVLFVAWAVAFSMALFEPDIAPASHTAGAGPSVDATVRPAV